MRSYIGFSRDHSASMRPIRAAAAADYNESIATIKEAAIANHQDVIVSVVECGHGREAVVNKAIVNASVTTLQPLTEYDADARGTPLFDSVDALIRIFQSVPDYADPDVSFLIMATTDGEENASKVLGLELASKMQTLQATDRWTFVFRVPKGGAKALKKFGIPEGNILEWEQTNRGMETASQHNKEAFTQYFTQRGAGQRSTTKFYANLADVSLQDVQNQLTDVTSQVTFFNVKPEEDGMQVRDFVESKLHGKPMVKGGAFYQLVKTEPKVQDYKRIAIRSKLDGKVYTGDAARHMLALPLIGTVRLAPDELGDWTVFIQSTSVNRKVTGSTQLMYWEAVGESFKEGRSAR